MITSATFASDEEFSFSSSDANVALVMIICGVIGATIYVASL